MTTQKQQPQQTKPAQQRNWIVQKRNPGVDSPIRFKCTLTNTILDVLRNRPGWEEVRPEEENLDQIDFFWCDREWVHTHYDQMYFSDHVRIEHFRNHFELTRKNLMAKNLKRMRKQVEKEQGKLEAQKWDFFPTTYELPSEYHIFVEEFKRNQGTIWIMKPAARSQGRGIFLFRKLKEIMDWRKVDSFTQSDGVVQPPPETYVVSRYVANPYLIGGRKFDMRIYVLVTSYNPLKVWLYREGFARFSITRFNLEALEDTYVHLTNVAVQKTAPDYDPEKGCKWSTHRLREYLIAKHGIARTEELFRNIDDIFIKSLLSVQKVIINDKHCFEMYGYDILIDDNLKPWLLEINASPSLTASSKDDYELKCRLLDDVLNIIDMESRLTGRERAVGGWDLIWNDGPVSYEDPGCESLYSANFSHNSFLGCYADRQTQLLKLYRDMALAKQQQAAPPAGNTQANTQAVKGNRGANATGHSVTTVRKVNDDLSSVTNSGHATEKSVTVQQDVANKENVGLPGDLNADETDPNVNALLNYAAEEANENRYEGRDEE